MLRYATVCCAKLHSTTKSIAMLQFSLVGCPVRAVALWLLLHAMWRALTGGAAVPKMRVQGQLKRKSLTELERELDDERMNRIAAEEQAVSHGIENCVIQWSPILSFA